jgi:signal peptidase I
MANRSVWPAVLAVGIGSGLVGAVLSRPIRCEVQGLSMGPGLLPGDVVRSACWPQADRFRRPGRYERWTVRDPVGERAVKRVVAGDGETLAIMEGDLVVDGRVTPKPPRVLAELAVGVRCDRSPERSGAFGADAGGSGCRAWRHEQPVVYDDVAFAPLERRWLAPVRDVGFAAVVRLLEAGPTRIGCRVGDRMIRWSPPGPGLVALVAGRLDRHLVATAWHLPADTVADHAVAASWSVDDREPSGFGRGRAWFPRGLPDAWSLALPLSGAPRKAIRLAIELAGGDATIVNTTVWRDVRYAADPSAGSDWTIPRGCWFLLGDHPPASLDSRHWGPLSRERLLHRVWRQP